MNSPTTLKSSAIPPRDTLALGILVILIGVAATVPLALYASWYAGIGVAITCLGLTGVGRTIKPMLALRKISNAQVTISSEAPRVGDSIVVMYTQRAKAQVNLSECTLTLIFREEVSDRSGDSTTVYKEDSVIDTIFYSTIMLTKGDLIERRWEIQIPENAMHSFTGRDTKLVWMIQTKRRLAGSHTYEDEFPFTVIA